jgi:hypothetical protein
MHTMYVLTYQNGSLAGIDLQTGGYPYEAWNPATGGSLDGVKFYVSKDSAENLVATVYRELTVKEFQFAILPLLKD